MQQRYVQTSGRTSGKLTDTWAENYSDYPASATFAKADGDSMKEWYKEGIYVGYRYFDTFGIKPAYEFGYGLSAEVLQKISAESICWILSKKVTRSFGKIIRYTSQLVPASVLVPVFLFR